MKQSHEGQLLAIQINMRAYHDDHNRISDDSWNQLLVASGMWAKVVEKLFLAILFNPELITALGIEVMSLPDFRTDIAHMASKEPAVAVSALGDIVARFVQSVGRLRRAKQ